MQQPSGPPEVPSMATSSVPSSEPQPPGSAPRRRKWLVIGAVGAVAVLLVCCLAAAGAWGYFAYRRGAATGDVRQAFAKVAVAEGALEPIDAMLDKDFAGVEDIDLDDLERRVDAAVAEVAPWTQRVESARGALQGDAKTVAERTAALLDLEMDALGHAKTIIGAARRGSAAARTAKRGWKDVVEERELVGRGVTAYNKHTEAGARQSAVLFRRALAKARAARSEYSAAATAFPEADFSKHLEYARRRIAQIQVGLRMNDTYIAGDRDDANDLASTFNATGQALRTLLNGLQSPRDTRPVSDGIRAAAGEAPTSYSDARSRARLEAAALGSVIEGLD